MTSALFLSDWATALSLTSSLSTCFLSSFLSLASFLTSFLQWWLSLVFSLLRSVVLLLLWCFSFSFSFSLLLLLFWRSLSRLLDWWWLLLSLLLLLLLSIRLRSRWRSFSLLLCPTFSILQIIPLIPKNESSFQSCHSKI